MVYEGSQESRDKMLIGFSSIFLKINNKTFVFVGESIFETLW